MNLFIIILIKALDIYLTCIIVSVALNWLVVLEILNIRNRIVRAIYEGLNSFIDPPMALVRRFVPPIGMIDITPMVVIFAIYILQSILISLL